MVRNKSFTLIELLVVIAIIGLLASVVLVSMGGIKSKARITKTLEFSQSIQRGLGAYAVGIWSFDDQANPTKDSSGYGNNGTVNGATFVSDTPYAAIDRGTGKYALSFDGTNDYVAFTPIAYGEYTFEFWYKFNVANSYQGILGFNYPGTDHRGMEIFGSPNYSLFFYTNETAPTSYVRFNGVPNDTNWHHLVFYFPGGNPTTMENSKLYIDGAAYSITDYSNMAPRTWPTLTLGYNNGNYNAGLIDDVRIYEEALTLGEIQQQYAEGLERHQNLAIK